MTTGDDWGLDLTPVRPGEAGVRGERWEGSDPQSDPPLEVAAGLDEIRRAIGRVSLRIGRIERLLESIVEPEAAEPAPADAEISADIAVRRLSRLRPRRLSQAGEAGEAEAAELPTTDRRQAGA